MPRTAGRICFYFMRICAIALLCVASLHAENLALNKPYTFSHKPNYAPCTDPNDNVQLTDGVYTITNDNFWADKRTVGWRISSVLSITIDLGETLPIGGFQYSTAFGKAQVVIPDFIYVYVSDNQNEWHYIGDLLAKSIEKSGKPEQDKYIYYKAVSNDMPCKGRYVCFLIKQTRYTFVDEIEVFRGDDSLLANPPSHEMTTKPMVHYLDKIFQALVAADIQQLQAGIDRLGEDAKKELSAELADYRRNKLGKLSIGGLDCIPIFPLNENHIAFFALNAKYLQACGFDKPLIWRNCRWDNLNPIVVPSSKDKPDPLEVEMMRGEVRSEAFNILNPTDVPLTFKIEANGLPKGCGIEFREVIGMLTSQMKYSASALKPGDGASISVEVPSGMSKQIWVTFKRPTLKAGLYKATVSAVAGKTSISVPLRLRIHDFDFPKEPRLHVGGCDYLDGDCDYYRGKNCVPATIAMMRSFYNDSPWCRRIVLPKGAKFDENGHLLNADELDYTEWEKWIARWGDVRFYFVFISGGAQFHGEKMGTPRFNRMIEEYFTAWANYLRDHGIPTSKVVLLLVDEPCFEERDKRIIAWAKPIRASKTGFVILENPIWVKPEEGDPEMYASCDILCPNTVFMHNSEDVEAYRKFYLDYRDKGMTLWLNSCSGPARLLDPVTYHRGQEWRAFEMSAEGSIFWAFGCGGSIGDSWHPFRQTSPEYSPFMVSPDKGPMDAKHSEALREGVQDYEYLCMLRDRIATLKKIVYLSKARQQKLAEAEKLLAVAPLRALELTPVPGSPKWSQKSAIMWDDEKDRTHMDAEARKVLQMLSELK